MSYASTIEEVVSNFKKHKPKNLEEILRLCVTGLSYINRGSFRVAYKVHRLPLVVKVPTLNCDDLCTNDFNNISIEELENKCVRCGKNKAKEDSINCSECLEGRRLLNLKYKRICFDHYGRICTCCKTEFDERFLSLDHINNDGCEHRKKITMNLYSWAIKNNFPDILQTHCFNCNFGKNVNGGICPHQEK